MKILIISRHTYPKQSPRAYRTAELSEQLVKMGHEVVLYTVQGKYDYTAYEKETGVQMRAINTRWATDANDGTMRYTFLDKFLFHYFHRLLIFPEIEFRYLISSIIKANPGFDLLLTIAYPHTIHMGAALAKKKYPDLFPKIWIADCGDPFYFNPFEKVPKYIEKYEREWCELVDFITIPIEEGKEGYFPEYRDKISIIPQGFDFSKTPIASYKPHDIPTFAYAGGLYGKRNPIDFFKYLSKKDIPFRFYVFTQNPLNKEYKDILGDKLINVVGKNRKECIFETSKMDFLVNFTNPSSIQSPSKLIDYGITKRPIIDIHIPFDDDTVFNEFVNKVYTNQHYIKNLNDYRIDNVAIKFIQLADTII